MREIPALARLSAQRRAPSRWMARLGPCALAAVLAAPGLAQAPRPRQTPQTPVAPTGGDQRQFFQAATRLVAHGQREQAARLARTRPAGDPDAAAILGRLAADRGDYDGALTLLRPAAAAHPTSEAALELGLLQLTLGRRAGGRGTLTRIVDASAAFRTAGEVVRLARAARALGEFRSANALFREADSLAPRDPGVNAAWGDLFLEKYNRADAEQSYRAALAIDPQWAPAHAGLARTLAEDNPPAAAAEAAKALTTDPAGSVAYRLPSELVARRYRFDEAAALARKAIALDPDDTHAQADLGMHLLRTGDEAGARQVLERAFESDPYDVVAFNLLSLLDSLG